MAPEGRKLLRLEVRNAETPIERKPPWIRTRARTGPQYTELKALGALRRPAHRLRGGGLPQHLRVLGRPRGHVPHRRRAVHAPLRLLPDRHRQARRARPRRAAPGRRVGAHDGPALLHGHRRRPRRPARRRRLALRRDRPPDPRAQPGHRRRAADPRLQLPSTTSSPRCSTPGPRCSRTTWRPSRGSSSASGPRSATTARSTVLTKARAAGLVTKSNLILGMGETPDEVTAALPTCTTRVARSSRSRSTCGPTPRHHPVERWVKPEEFVAHAKAAEEMGFAGVMAGPLVRSSYRAGRLYAQTKQRRGEAAARRPGAPGRRGYRGPGGRLAPRALELS